MSFYELLWASMSFYERRAQRFDRVLILTAENTASIG